MPASARQWSPFLLRRVWKNRMTRFSSCGASESFCWVCQCFARCWGHFLLICHIIFYAYCMSWLIFFCHYAFVPFDLLFLCFGMHFHLFRHRKQFEIMHAQQGGAEIRSTHVNKSLDKLKFKKMSQLWVQLHAISSLRLCTYSVYVCICTCITYVVGTYVELFILRGLASVLRF